MKQALFCFFIVFIGRFCQRVNCLTGFEKLSNFGSNSFIYATLSKSSTLDGCTKICKDDPKCLAITYSTLHFSCTFHNDTPKNFTMLIEQPDSFYFLKINISTSKDFTGCSTVWMFDRFPNHQLEGFHDVVITPVTKDYCLSQCLTSKDFICRSVEYDYMNLECRMNTDDRKSRSFAFQYIKNVDYFENQCLTSGDWCDGKIVFEKFYNHAVPLYYKDRIVSAESLAVCQQLCLQETAFICMSLLYDPITYRCEIYHSYYQSFQNDAIFLNQKVIFPIVLNTSAYYETICLKEIETCNPDSLTIIRFQNVELEGSRNQLVENDISFRDCIELCLIDRATYFSFSYNFINGTCILHNLTHKEGVTGHLTYSEGNNYFELICEQRTKRFTEDRCNFTKSLGKIAKEFVAYSFFNVTFEKCLNACQDAKSYNCHSFSYDSKNKLCLISTEDMLAQPSLVEVKWNETFDFYELGPCSEVSFQCLPGKILVNVEMNMEFNGLIYTSGGYESCGLDITSSTIFSFVIPLNKRECNTRSTNDGGAYVNTVVLQHHDEIVTKKDRHYRIVCKYDIPPQILSLQDFTIVSRLSNIANVTVTLPVPEVWLQILTLERKEVKIGNVGDKLLFEVKMSPSSSYGMWLTDCFALGKDPKKKFRIIDDNGCSVIPELFSNFQRRGKSLEAIFEVFQFPGSNSVSFYCTAKFCITDCRKNNCQSVSSRLGRSIKDFSDILNNETEPTINIRQDIIVMNNFKDEIWQAKKSLGNFDTVCLDRDVITFAFTAFSVMMTIAFAVMVFICYCSCTQKFKSHQKKILL